MRIGLYSSALSALALAVAVPAFAQPVQDSRAFAIDAGPLDQSLQQFADQSGVQLLYPADLVTGRRGQSVRGLHTPSAALTTLLSGSGLSYRQTAPNVFVLRLLSAANRAEENRDDATTLDEVVVTGSYFRGVTGPSPVTVINRDDIDKSGHATVAAALAALPQNFGGAANEGTSGNGADRSGQNIGFASGVNLRGLGADATLVLVNGRRLGGTGISGDFADISTIPTSAVQRVEVLLDGASALYGSDAIGGVVNIILRDDFEGFETRARIGSTTDGASGERQFAQTGGLGWTSGNALLSYEYHERDELQARDRRYAGDTDLRSLGGTDRRQFYAAPGNVMGFAPSGGSLTPLYAIPAGQPGVGLTASDFIAGQVNLQNQQEGRWVLPHQTRHSLFAALNQDLGSGFRLKADARYGDRRFQTQSPAAIGLFTVTSANPYFVSPTGATSNQIAYSFINDLGPANDSGRTRSFGAAVGVEGEIGRWGVSGYLSSAEERLRTHAYNRVNTTHLAEALGATPDNPSTAFNTATDGYFNPYGDPASNTPAVLAFVGSGFQRTLSISDVLSANLKLDGEVVELPAGPLLFAAGLDYREESFELGGTSWFSGTAISTTIPTPSERTVASAFSELRIPVFSAQNAVPGFRRLELSLAGRIERFNDIGSTRNPKIGLIWSPIDSVVVRVSHGSSFRAPSLPELTSPYSLSPTILPRGADRIVTLMRYGGNPDLKPETARTTTINLIWTPPAFEGLSLGLTGFKTDFRNRIGTPARDNTATTLADPAVASFVTFVDPANNAADRALIESYLSDPRTAFPNTYPVEVYGAIVDARYVNAAVLRLEGVDLDARYSRPLAGGDLTLEGNASYLSTYERQFTASGPVERLLGQPNFPTAWRGRAGGSWRRDRVTVGLYANYVDGGVDPIGKRGIRSWTTLDSVARLELDGLFQNTKDLSLTLSVQNMLDEDPPFYDSPRGIGYDAANANVVGRQAALQLTKRW